MPAKLDLYKAHASEYVAPRRPVLVDISPATYLAIDGEGSPGSALFQEQIGGLYSMAFTIKMASKFSGRDYAVSKLEGLWWGGTKPEGEWSWRLMIRTPDFIAEQERRAALAALAERGRDGPARAVRLLELEEGRSVQMLHVGPYTEEAPTIAAMEQFARDEGLELHGRHHEIYLSDPRRVASERLRTILRHPVRAAKKRRSGDVRA